MGILFFLLNLGVKLFDKIEGKCNVEIFSCKVEVFLEEVIGWMFFLVEIWYDCGRIINVVLEMY